MHSGSEPGRLEEHAESVERIWEAFHGRLRSFLLARVRDAHHADDILQDVFLKVHRSVDSLRDEERLAPWLYQIARNAITDHHRRERGETISDVDTLAGLADPGDDPIVVEQKLAEGLFDMVEELPETYREAIRCTEIEGLTQAEMAVRLGLSLSGGKSRVQRGREKLKELLLDCCHVEFDHRGGIVGYERRDACCRAREKKR